MSGFACCRHCPEDPSYHTDNPPDSHDTSCPTCDREGSDEAIRAAKAEAWDDGWNAAYGMARGWGHVDGWEGPWPTNPYLPSAAS